MSHSGVPLKKGGFIKYNYISYFLIYFNKSYGTFFFNSKSMIPVNIYILYGDPIYVSQISNCLNIIIINYRKNLFYIQFFYFINKIFQEKIVVVLIHYNQFLPSIHLISAQMAEDKTYHIESKQINILIII